MGHLRDPQHRHQTSLGASRQDPNSLNCWDPVTTKAVSESEIAQGQWHLNPCPQPCASARALRSEQPHALPCYHRKKQERDCATSPLRRGASTSSPRGQPSVSRALSRRREVFLSAPMAAAARSISSRMYVPFFLPFMALPIFGLQFWLPSNMS